MEKEEMKKYIRYSVLALGAGGLFLSFILFVVLYIAMDSLEKTIVSEIFLASDSVKKVEDTIAGVEGELTNVDASIAGLDTSITSLHKGVKAGGDSLTSVGDQLGAISIIPGIAQSGQKIKQAGMELNNAAAELEALKGTFGAHLESTAGIKQKIGELHASITNQRMKLVDLETELSNFFMLIKVASFIGSATLAFMFVALMLVEVEHL